MNFKELWDKCWKGITILAAMLTTLGVLSSFYSNLATSADLEKVKDEFKKSMELERTLNKLDRVNDNIQRLRIQQRDYPKDKNIAEDLEQAKKEKAILQERVEKR
jgi:hypothetical protein